MIVAGVLDASKALAEWHRLATFVRAEGWDVDETRIPSEFTYSDFVIRVRQPVPFDMTSVALYLTTDDTPLILAVAHGNGPFPDRINDSSLLVVEAPIPDAVALASATSES